MARGLSGGSSEAENDSFIHSFIHPNFFEHVLCVRQLENHCR